MEKTIQQQADDLVNTSIADMHSSLRCAETNKTLNLAVMKAALEVVTRRRERTKQILLERFIKIKKKQDEQDRNYRMFLQQ